MQESNVINMFTAEIPVKGTIERDRGYFRRQRIRKISERSIQAKQAHIEIMASGQLSKTSPFGLMRGFRDFRRPPRGKKGLAFQIKAFLDVA